MGGTRPPLSVVAAPRPACAACRHFMDDPAALERAFPGFSAMGSARASVRAGDGICERHGVYVSAHDGCGDFSARMSGENSASEVNGGSPSRLRSQSR
jgi:hypothetical protein